MPTCKRRYASGKILWGYAFDGPRLEGKRNRIAKWGFSTKKEAELAEATKRLEIDKTARITRPPATLGDLLDQFCLKHADRNLAPKTAQRYRELAEYISPLLKERPVAEVTPLDLNAEWERLLDSGGHHRKTKAARPLSTKTVRNIAGLLSSAYGRAIFWGFCTVNPVTNSEPPKVRKRPAASFSVDQQRLFLEASAHWVLPIILELAAATGARRGEVLALRWSDLNADEVFIGRSLSQTKSGLIFKEPKGGTFRGITIPDSTLLALADHRKKQDIWRKQFGPDYRTDLDLVIATPEGEPLRPDSVSSSVSLLAKKLKIRGSLHSLRHTHGSHLLAAGMELPAVSSRLGHSSVYVTATVYAHAVSGRDKEAAKLWEKFQGREDRKEKAS